MKAWLASLLLIAICAATPAFAQDSVPPAGEPSQAQIDAAKDLLQASNATTMMQSMLDNIMPLQAAQLRREHPTASDETIKTLLGIVNGAIRNHIGDMVQIYAVAYARRFSVEELHALADFYRSDVGQKYLKELPGMMKEMLPLASAYLRQAIQQDIQSAVEKLRAQGEKI